VGVALNREFKERALAREVIHQFAISFFAPLYFVSLGLRVNFVKDFDLLLVVMVLVIACVGKIVGAGLGAWVGGLTRRESLVVGVGMSARGVMELILATVALQHGLIDNRIFVALFIMAVATSMMSGPLMKRLMQPDRTSLVPMRREEEAEEEQEEEAVAGAGTLAGIADFSI
jgi:Kef-type K+ transport system membrane component KefB